MWYRDDVRNVLAGLELASAGTACIVTRDEQMAFRAGFRAALMATAVSFGLTPLEVGLDSTIRDAAEWRNAHTPRALPG